MPRLGVIDLGSNSIRLVIYETKSKSGRAKPFRTLVDEKKMAGLSSYVECGTLAHRGIEKAITVLNSLLRLARNLDCKRVDVFATAVLRNCANSRDATLALEDAIGQSVQVLTACEEAHLGFVGASIGRELEHGTLIDIGGGSAELTALRPDGDHDGISLPIGCISLYARSVDTVIPAPDECEAMTHACMELLDEAAGLEKYRTEHAYAIGGSTRCVSRLIAQIDGLVPKPTVITREDIRQLFELLNDDAPAFAHALVKAAPERVHSLVPGMVILHAIMERLGMQDVTICKYGIREGYLLTHML